MKPTSPRVQSNPRLLWFLAGMSGTRWLRGLSWLLLRSTLPPRFVEDAGDEARRYRERVREHWFPHITGDSRMEEPEVRKRMAVDGVASPEECATLIDFARDQAEIGGGYRGNPHPHNEDEVFSGYAFPGGIDGDKPAEALAGELVERVRSHIMMYFGLPELWLGYLHLVRRTVVSGGLLKPDELSHDWHRDDGGHFWWRTHSAILYLNDDFEGGEFVFREDKRTTRRRIQPRPGRLVAFTGGPENVHGVAKLRTGERCVLALWFSVSPLLQVKHHQILK